MFREHLGLDFMDILLEDISDHSSTALWTAGTYAENTLKRYTDNVVYKVNVSSTALEPTINNTDWVPADKFETPCYQALWCDGYLKELLSYAAVKFNMPTIKAKLTSSGFVTLKDETSQKANTKEYEGRVFVQEAFVSELLLMMDRYITAFLKENDSSTCFDEYLPVYNKKKAGLSLDCTKVDEKVKNGGRAWVA